MPLATAGNGATKNFHLSGFKEGWVWAQRPWSSISEDTGSGNPAFATAEKGALFTEKTIQQIGNFLYDLTVSPIDQLIQ